jgi:formylglycine-generating enzyme required for sulfatase activity
LTKVEVTSARECIGHRKAPTGIAGQAGFAAGGAEEEQFSAFLVYSNGQQVDVTEKATWSAVKWGSGDAATSGEINSGGTQGLFKADKDVKYLETVKVKAAYGGLSGSKRLVVGAVEVPAIMEANHEAVDLRIGIDPDYTKGVLIKQIDVFYIGQYEVTNRDFCEFLNDMRAQGVDNPSEAGDEETPLSRWWWPFNDTRYNGIIDNGDAAETRYTVRPGFDARPVVYVPWYGAVAYCNWLTEKQGLGADQCCYGGYAEDGSLRWGASGANYKPANNGWRLPTEVEWIYACRINKSDGSLAKTEYFWGNTLNQTEPDTGWDYLWFTGNTGNENDGYDHKEVGLKLPNGLGLYDITGNAGEWVSDWVGVEFPYDDFPGGLNNKNPKGYKDFNQALGKGRIISGGCFRSVGAFCSFCVRSYDAANIGFITRGLRIVRTK